MKRVVILGVAESDAHAVANQLIAHQLREDGFLVVNLGVCTALTEFADAVRRYPEAEAVIIGSLNGHARADLSGLPALRAAGQLRCPVIVGGNLSVGSEKSAHTEVALIDDLGIDHIVHDPNDLVALLDRIHVPHPEELEDNATLG